MGYVYRDGSLVCDKCTSKGAEPRLCPYFVTEPSGQRLRYCSPSALCAGCFAEIGGRLHAKCKQGARDSQAENDSKSARLAAGEQFISSALSGCTWHVPEGLVGASFDGRGTVKTWRLIPQADYHREYRAKGLMLALSDFPGAAVWEDDPDARAAREAGTEQAYVVGPVSVPSCPQFEQFEVTAPAGDAGFGEVRRTAEQRLGHEHFWIVRRDTLAEAGA